jgi:membrane protease YdiL (CAAX protease family)
MTTTRTEAATPGGSPGRPSQALAAVRWPFAGAAGLRGGWRVLLFFFLFIVGSEILESRLPLGHFTPLRMLARESTMLGVVVGATLLLGAFEGRSLGDYGLPHAGTAGRRAATGTLLGVTALSALLGVLRLLGVLSFDAAMLAPGAILLAGLGWAVAFLVVALFEELLLRGYAQATLTRSLGFWPAAVLLSGLFAAMHARNPGETPLGLAAVFAFGLFFSLTLWRTGSLWLAVGFHASWDWAESFLYGVPNSGTMVSGHFLEAAAHGPAWLSGGTAGPEGSVLILATLSLAALAVGFPRAPGLPRAG